MISLGLCLLSALLFSLAYAPVGQFYLAWIALTPWIISVARSKSWKSTFFINWPVGWIFFAANVGWLTDVTLPGTIGLTMYCGFYWGLAAVIVRGTGWLQNKRIGWAMVGIPAIWAGLEWFRGGFLSGFPWLFAGHTQSPLLAVCQIADLAGVYGISFVLAMVGTLAALAILNRKSLVKMRVPAGITLAVVVLVLAYGWLRMKQTAGCVTAGPMVAAIQANYPQSNSGAKGASAEERLDLHLRLSRQALATGPGQVNLIVWSETMLISLNHQALDKENKIGQKSVEDVSDFSRANNVPVLTGADYADAFPIVTIEGKEYWGVPKIRHNSAYLFDSLGRLDDSALGRYDKNHLVPFGEYIPFRESAPFLYRLLLKLGPNEYADYQLEPGDMDHLTVFKIDGPAGKPLRVVTPICFEDSDAGLCAAMLCPEAASAGKRADLMVNLTNDGWFKRDENAKHLQTAIFRAIENRTPLVRCVNTGISAFINSNGEVEATLPARTEGYLLHRVNLDSRLTVYTLYGDWFAMVCAAGAGMAAWIGVRRWKIAGKNGRCGQGA